MMQDYGVVMVEGSQNEVRLEEDAVADALQVVAVVVHCGASDCHLQEIFTGFVHQCFIMTAFVQPKIVCEVFRVIFGVPHQN